MSDTGERLEVTTITGEDPRWILLDRVCGDRQYYLELLTDNNVTLQVFAADVDGLKSEDEDPLSEPVSCDMNAAMVLIDYVFNYTDNGYPKLSDTLGENTMPNLSDVADLTVSELLDQVIAAIRAKSPDLAADEDDSADDA